MHFSVQFLALTLFLLPAFCEYLVIPEVDAAVQSILHQYSNYTKYSGLTKEARTTVQNIRAGAVSDSIRAADASTPYWLENINHQGISAFGPSGYQVFRNVKNFGAKGDGVTDDTAAINAAISSGGRCGRGCASSTTTPAVVYFPAGTYLISSSIVQYYYTQMIGNPNNPPVLKATSVFSGFGLIDGDPYYISNLNWVSTNVFMRQIRNLVIDTTNIPASSAATGIHWPTAQATSIQNVVFQLSAAPGTQHVGLFIESGSAGVLVDLTFNGGYRAASLGNQQYTMRNLVFNNAVTAIYHFWDWSWAYKSISINNCQIGIDISAGGRTGQQVGSITLYDSSITNTPTGILSARDSSSSPAAGGSIILENVILTNVPVAVRNAAGTVLAGTTGTTTIGAWGEGNAYTPGGPSTFSGSFTPTSRTASLLSGSKYYERSKPQYETLPLSSFVSMRSSGARGDGVTDDTTALQNAINSATGAGLVSFFDAGTYLVTSTLTIPPGAKLVGESYSVIMSSGNFFNNVNSPQPVVRVGATTGTYGRVEWSDMIVATRGAQAGATLIEWNLDTGGTPSGMWDVHTRIGGFAGSNLQVAQCPTSAAPSPSCMGAFMSMHVTTGASGLYMENVWLWTADHDIEDPNNTQISVFTGRGLYIESGVGTFWLAGTAVEHHAMYQYQLSGTHVIYFAQPQTETPYYQPNPPAPAPFSVVSSLNDPNFAATCAGKSGNCASAWGLRVIGTNTVFIYGAGFYSFFDHYSTGKLNPSHSSACSAVGNGETCQDSILSFEGGSNTISIYNLNTIGANSMADRDGSSIASYTNNINAFSDTIALLRP